MNSSVVLQPDHLNAIADIMLTQYNHNKQNGDAIRAYETFKAKSIQYLKKAQAPMQKK